MTMRWAGLMLIALLIPASAYAASPFWAAWSIREAVRSKDSAYLDGKIEWHTVKASLKESIGRMTGPDASASDENAGLWHRLKSYVSQRAVDGFVERYATPEGLPQLYSYRASYRSYTAADPDAGTSVPQRAARFWSRVHRAAFTSLTTFELEVADRFSAGRVYAIGLELEDFEWKLVTLHVRAAGELDQIARSTVP